MHVRSALLSLSGLLTLSLLAGCTFSPITAKVDPVTTAAIPGVTLTGTAHGGQQPIIAGRVYLLAAANPGDITGGPTPTTYGITAPSAGNASVSLLNPAATGIAGTDSIGAYVNTTATGGFQLAGDYTCTTGYAQSTGTSVTLSGQENVYILVKGGNSGSGTQNPSIGLIAAIGPCNGPFTKTISVNEITTVASAYAISGFATDSTHINSDFQTVFSSQGIYNAFATVQNLVNLSTGTALSTTPNGNGTVPASKIITLADIIAACVNSNGTNGNCATLFANAQSLGASGTVPTDTATAAINLAHNPYPSAAAMKALFGLLPGTPAFSNPLTAQPNDFTLAIAYSGGGLNGVDALAIDLNGNIWAANQSGNSLSEFSFLGVPSAASPITGGGLSGPVSLAFAPGTGHLWIANASNSSVSAYDPNSSSFVDGSPITNSTYLSFPYSIAIDPTGLVYAANIFSGKDFIYNDALSRSYSGQYCSYATSAYSYSAAIDGNFNVWQVNNNANALTQCSYFNGLNSPYPDGFTGGGLNGPEAIAFDSAGNAWVANLSANVLSEFNQSGSPVSGNGYTGGGLAGSYSLALDGSGRVWVSNGSSLSAFDSNGNPLSPSTGYTDSSLAIAKSVTIDISGNLWVANSNFGSGKTITEFIGAATPTYQPLVYGLPSSASGDGTSNLSTRP